MTNSGMTQSDTYPGWLAAARVIFGGYFLYAGIHHFRDLSTLAGFTASKGVPFPTAAVAGTGLLLMFGGASVMTGILPRFGALCLMVFLAGVTPVMHDFWNAPPQDYVNQFGNFMKNVALFGAACFAMAVPQPWPWSARAWAASPQ